MPGSTAILDNFTRANASTLGANWSLLTNFNFGGSDLGVISNQAYNPTGGTYISMYWSAATFGPDCECYLTLSTVSSDNISLYLRTQQPGYNTFDGYILTVDRTAGEFSIRRVDNGTETLLGAAVSQAVASGNKILFEAIGSTLTGYIDTGSGWVSVLSRTDATYAGAGGVGFYGGGNATSWRYDDFGGGTVSSFNPTQTVTETGSGADSDSGVRAATLAETPSGTDASAGQSSATIAEAGSGVDASSGVRASSIADSATGADASTQQLGDVVADSASGSDSASSARSGSSAETGSASDSAAGLLAASVADSATAADAVSSSGSGTGSASDTGAGTDTSSGAVVSTAADSAAGADLPSGFIQIAIADVARAVDLSASGASAFAPGTIRGPSADGAARSPNAAGTARSPNTTGTING